MSIQQSLFLLADHMCDDTFWMRSPSDVFWTPSWRYERLLFAIQWSPDSQLLLFGVSGGEIHIYDHAGNYLVSLVTPTVVLNCFAWMLFHLVRSLKSSVLLIGNPFQISFIQVGPPSSLNPRGLSFFTLCNKLFKLLLCLISVVTAWQHYLW